MSNRPRETQILHVHMLIFLGKFQCLSEAVAGRKDWEHLQEFAKFYLENVFCQLLKRYAK
jgi:hypothetical protein